MLMIIASRVFTTRHHHHIVIHLLRLLGQHIAFALLSHHIANDTFLRLQIIRNLFRFVLVFLVFENRLSFQLIVDAVIHAARINDIAIHIAANIIRLQLHFLIVNRALSMQKCISVTQHHHRILRRVTNRSI